MERICSSFARPMMQTMVATMATTPICRSRARRARSSLGSSTLGFPYAGSILARYSTTRGRGLDTRARSSLATRPPASPTRRPPDPNAGPGHPQIQLGALVLRVIRRRPRGRKQSGGSTSDEHLLENVSGRRRVGMLGVRPRMTLTGKPGIRLIRTRLSGVRTPQPPGRPPRRRGPSTKSPTDSR